MRRHVGIVGGLAILVAISVLFGGDAAGYVQAGYPKDTIKREALARCASADPNFFRFSAKDRAECYATAHLPLTASAER